MTSQVSTLKLLKQEIRQNGWMFGLTTLGHFLTGPVVFLLHTSYYANWTTTNAQNRYLDYFTDSYFIWQIITMIACICIAIFIYRYLFSRRMVDLYHSVPISRSQLFLVKYLHGFLIWFVPFAVSGLSILLLFLFRSLGKPYLLTILGTQLKCMALLLLCFFVFYHLFLTAVYLSGNTINMFTNTAIIGCSIVGIWSSCYSCAGNYFDTFAYTPSSLLYDIVYSFSPFTAPFAMCSYLATDELFSDHMPLVILSLLITLGLLELAWMLCLKRPSELAERGTIAKRYTIAARIIMSVLAGMAGALFFGAIVSDTQQLAWGIFGALLCSIVCFGAVNSIFQATIKGFFKYKPQMAFATIISTFIILAFQLDWFGYDSYLPKRENIAGVAIYTHQLSDDSSYIRLRSVNRSGGLTWERNSNVAQENLMTDPDLCYDLLDTFVNADAEGSYTSYYTKVKLKNGRTYERRYLLPDNQYIAVAPFIEADAYKETNYKFSTGAFGYPTKLTVDLWDVNFNVAGRELEQIMDAYWADFEEHYTLKELSSYMRVCALSGQYGTDSDYGSRYFSLDVHSNYSRTLAVLEELYPEYETAVSTPDEIKELCMYADVYEGIAKGEYSIDSLYEYFGYEVTGKPSDENEAAKESTIVSENGRYAPPTFVEATASSAQIVAVAELFIHEPEILKELYPLLYFGSYRDIFDQQEYIYLGHIITGKNSSVNCYVKPGTLPQKFIQMLYDTRKEY